MEISFQDHIAYLHLSDTETSNAFDLKKAKQIQKILRNKKISLLFCTSEGRVFCSGGDLKKYALLKNKKEGLKINREIRNILNQLARSPIYKVAWVQGDCFGGGIEFLSAFDWIGAEEQVLFGFWQNKLDLSYGWGGWGRLQQKMTEKSVLGALVKEELWTSFQAQQSGLVDFMGSKNEFLSMQKKLIQKFAKTDSKKEILKNIRKNEVSLFEKLWWSKSHLAHLNKFTNKF